MGAFGFFRQVAFAGAAGLIALVASPCGARCSPAASQTAPEPELTAELCPRTLYLETQMVRVFETSDNAQDMLHAACLQASAKALAQWRVQALASRIPSTRACAAKMGAQGCLMGQAFTQPHCTDRLCPLTQKCVVSLVRLQRAPGARAPKPQMAPVGAPVHGA